MIERQEVDVIFGPFCTPGNLHTHSVATNSCVINVNDNKIYYTVFIKGR